MSQKPVLERGLAYLAAQQQGDGSFLSYSSPSARPFRARYTYRTSFATSIIAACLASLKAPMAEDITQKATDFLLGERSSHGSFNYWARTSPEAQTLPYPDDLDCTACAWLALYQTRPVIFDGPVLAAATRLLISQEVEPGGPYYTWVLPRHGSGRWDDVDPVVNANLRFFLRQIGVTLAPLNTWVNRAARHKTAASLYYPSDIVRSYFLARSGLTATAASEVRRRVLGERQPGGHWDTPLETALAVTTLLRLGAASSEVAAAVAYLQRRQRRDGSWAVDAFWIDPARQGNTHYAGGSTLTTAVCVEALQTYATSLAASNTVESPESGDGSAQARALQQLVRRRIRAIEQPELRQDVQTLARRVLQSKNGQQLLLLPWQVASAAGVRLPPANAEVLSLITGWGWLAYTGQDDIIDNEADGGLLPATNWCLQQLYATILQAGVVVRAFQKEAQTILTQQDAANAWELHHCRGRLQGAVLKLAKLPAYGDHRQLAERSLGHSIAPLGVLFFAGLPLESPQYGALRSFFRAYLIARQLNDDAHDWQADLRAGRINAVSAMVLEQWQAKLGKPGRVIRLNLDQVMPRLQEIMWQEVIVTVMQLVADQLSQARHAIADPMLGLQAKPFEQLLQPIEEAMQRTETMRQDNLDFIAAF